MKDIVIYGASGFGMEVAFLIEDINSARPTWNLIGYLDDDRSRWGTSVYDYRVLGGRELLPDLSKSTAVAVAVAAPEVRKSLVEQVLGPGWEFPVLVHPGVIKSRAVEIGRGTIICAGCVLTVQITLGTHVHVNPGCTIGHETTIEDYVTLYPGINVAGNVRVRACASLGTGSRVIQGLEIGAHAFLGAGSVAIRNVPAGMVSVGCPAVPKKKRYPFDEIPH